LGPGGDFGAQLFGELVAVDELGCHFLKIEKSERKCKTPD
jgi:hypothetical protein